MPDAVLLINLDGRVTGYNQEALRQYEYSPDEMLRLTIPDFEAKETLDEHLAHKHNIVTTGRDDFETRHHTKTGRIIDIKAAVRIVMMPDGTQIFQCTFRDISNQKEAHQRIEFLANHDHLTNLPNRRLLRDRMERAIGNAVRYGNKVALLFLDLDHFKIINDTLGHEVGDLLLQTVADRLRSCVREQDSVARIGGDEFVVILVDLPSNEAASCVARKIVDTLSSPYLTGGYDLHTSPSIGISMYPDDGNGFDALLQQADAAMYHVKENGRAGFRFFREEMNLRTQERLLIEHDLHRALEREEFELYYQPKVDSRTGRIIGGEALIRWRHPEQGMVSPGQFIPVAEQSNLINSIGEWVVRAVCAQSRVWADAGLVSIPISFNVSARQFLYGDLPTTLAHALQDTGADPAMLEVELTESVLMRPQDVEEMLAAIKTMGFRIALDDFGTGYSSLAYLRKMAIDTIKIDRSFVNELERNSDDVVIVQTLIATALNLKMEMIAEGVETLGQAEILCHSGCCSCQGYYFGKPMPAQEFAKLLPRREA
jgi:diguanylate cyclase (GGDEF)-like protein/PAS domain S-box-containing protein